MIRDSLKSKQVLLTGAGLLIILLLFILPFLLSGNDEKQKKETETVKSNPYEIASRRVFIQDIDRVKGLAGDTALQKRVEQVLFLMVSQGGLSKNLYTGTVQPGSYTETLNYKPGGNSRIGQFRVDIEPVRMTYRVITREEKGITYVNALCAPEEFQVDKSVTCREVDWE